MSAIRFRLIAPAVLLCIVTAASAASGQATAQAPALRSPDVIFVPTPPEVVEAMLKLARWVQTTSSTISDPAMAASRIAGQANVQSPIGDGDRH